MARTTGWRVDAGGGGAWLLSDYQGSVTTLVRLDGGAVLDSISYDAFGNITSDADPSDGGRIKFQGGEYDSITGTYLFGQDGRIYNPQTGTWNRPDPDSFAAGQSNLYEAMGNAQRMGQIRRDGGPRTGLSTALQRNTATMRR